MKLKERLKNAGFWVSLISSVFLILGAFGVEIADETASSVINAVCSALVVFGIISDPTTGKGYLDAAKRDGGIADVLVSAAESAASDTKSEQEKTETSADVGSELRSEDGGSVDA